MTTRATILLICTLAGAARADVAGDLARGSAALTGRQLGAASAAFRRAFEAEDATSEQREAAFDGLLQAEFAAGRLAALSTYITGRLADAPDDQRGALLVAAARCRWAKEGHLAGVAADLQGAGDKRDYDNNRRLYRDVRNVSSETARAVAQLAESLRAAAVKSWQKTAKPDRASVANASRPYALEHVRHVPYEGRAERLTAPAKRRNKQIERSVRITPMTLSRYRAYRPDTVVKPPVLNRKVSGLASRLFSRYYSLASQLAADGRFAEAKDAYATILQLFPGSPQAAQAAQYAIRLFEKERGADRGAEALAGFLRWIREDVGVEQTDYAEYLAFQRFGRKGDPAIIADEAQGFLTRHPDSKWAPGIRLQLAVALDGQGKTDKAIEALKPATKTLDNSHNVRAATMLAWLHILRGEGDAARPLLEAAAAQGVSSESASEAARLLSQIQERPPVPIELKEIAGPEPQDEIVAERLLRAADRILAAGDPDRAMDLYTVYLRVGDDAPGYWEAKSRIERLKLKGRADEE